MKIIVTFINHKQRVDYQIDHEMKICDALDIIKVNDHFMITTDIRFVRSKRKEEAVSIFYTFRQAEIYSGDVIEVCDDGGKNI